MSLNYSHLTNLSSFFACPKNEAKKGTFSFLLNHVYKDDFLIFYKNKKSLYVSIIEHTGFYMVYE